MIKKEETNIILKQILKVLIKNEVRISNNESTKESNEITEKFKNDSEDATKKIQSTFDRIHDKLFNFNNMLIAAFLGLSKFPSQNPMLSLWISLLPIANLIFLMLLEYWQMEIYRHQAKQMNWKIHEDFEKYEKMVSSQTLRSFFSVITTFGLFILLVIKILTY